MNIGNQIKITRAKKYHRQSIVSLLRAEKLPVEDLPLLPDNFFVALDENNVIGAIGLEQYDNCGLLRSMAVNKDFRNKNIASNLVQELEKRAIELGIDCLYLFTETASQYFERKGYKKISRDSVPTSLQASSEFSSVCPVSAIVMKKSLTYI